MIVLKHKNAIKSVILNNIDFPLIAPSANISGKTSGIDAKEIAIDFTNTVDAIIDGGRAKLSTSSTIVKIVDEQVIIIREGTITKEQIEKVCK